MEKAMIPKVGDRIYCHTTTTDDKLLNIYYKGHFYKVTEFEESWPLKGEICIWIDHNFIGFRIEEYNNHFCDIVQMRKKKLEKLKYYA